MKEFEKWQESRAMKTIGYLNNSDAIKAGEKTGWKAALKWVKEKLNCEIEPGDVEYFIDRELQE